MNIYTIGTEVVYIESRVLKEGVIRQVRYTTDNEVEYFITSTGTPVNSEYVLPKDSSVFYDQLVYMMYNNVDTIEANVDLDTLLNHINNLINFCNNNFSVPSQHIFYERALYARDIVIHLLGREPNKQEVTVDAETGAFRRNLECVIQYMRSTNKYEKALVEKLEDIYKRL